MMKKYNSKKLLSCILCIVLTVAAALGTTGCSGGSKNKALDGKKGETSVSANGSVLGEGSKKFDLAVVDADGNETELEIHTDKTTVGDALTELGVIAGEPGDYGLYVKTVNGITADYDKDGKYWAFYINGEYAQKGVDAVEITDGDTYLFKVE